MMTDAWSLDGIYIGLIPLKDFEQNPPFSFKKQANGKLTFNLNDVNVFSDWNGLFETKPYPLEYVIDNRKALVDVKRQFLTVPTFLSYELINHNVFPPKAEKYMVLLNPKQQQIKDKLEDSMNQCIALFDMKVNYAMEFRVDDALAAFCRKHDSMKQFRVPYNSSAICITNCERRCQIWYRNPWCWTCFLPVALLIGLPYCLCRRCYAVDHVCSLFANVTHVQQYHDYHETSSSSLS